MAESPKTRTAPGPIGWYWGTSEDAETIHGPHSSRAAAVDAWLADCGDDLRHELEAEGDIPTPITDETLREMCPLAAMYRRPSISTEIFDADDLLERMEDHNETAVYPDWPLDPPADLKRALEQHMAAALFSFFEANDLWKEFRGLEHIGDLE